jgi:hypothetical protein
MHTYVHMHIIVVMSVHTYVCTCEHSPVRVSIHLYDVMRCGSAHSVRIVNSR